MIRSTRPILAFAVALLCCGTLLTAQTAPSRTGNVRVAVVDTTKVVEGYDKWKNYQAELRNLTSGHRNDMAARQQKLKDLQERIVAATPAERQRLEEQFVKDEIDAKVDAQMFEMTLKRTFDKYRDEVTADVREACRQVATRYNFDLVLSAGSRDDQANAGTRLNLDRQVLYYGPTVDITDRVVQVLNKK